MRTLTIMDYDISAEAALELANRLPRSADDVPVIPHMDSLWYYDEDDERYWEISLWVSETHFGYVDYNGETVETYAVCDGYTTEELAKEARDDVVDPDYTSTKDVPG